MDFDESETAELLATLVAIRSVNAMGAPAARGSSRESPTADLASGGLVSWLADWLHARGIDCERQPVGNGEENLIATVAGRSEAALLFDAHTDTVPAEDWADRAFAPRRVGGRIYGRGACDDKAALAAMLLALVAAARQAPLPRRVLLLASADEEFLRSGVRAFLAAPPPISAAVVGEPTSCEPVIACKGVARWNIVVHGRSAHSSKPEEGSNAIQRMAAVIEALTEYGQEVLSAKSHPLVGSPTIAPTLISGGTAVNLVPARCEVTVDLRTLPGEEPARAMGEAQAWLAGRLPFAVEHRDAHLWGGCDTPPAHPFVVQCLESCRRAAVPHVFRGGERAAPPVPTSKGGGPRTRRSAPQPEAIQLRGVSYGCHASDYAAHGIPAVIIGPGDIAVAHSVDEYVELAQVTRAAAIYYEIMSSPF